MTAGNNGIVQAWGYEDLIMDIPPLWGHILDTQYEDYV
ncbi:Hypothetical protein ABZS17I87_01987 [Kosakonia cowanii]